MKYIVLIALISGSIFAADEITTSAKMYVTKDGLTINKDITQDAQDMTNNAYASGVQEIPTNTHEVIAVGDVTDAGFAYFKNLSTNNYVEIGIDVGAVFCPFLKLLYGQCAGPMPLATTGIYSKAYGGAVKVEYVILAR